MRVFVTGATGFIGRAVVDELIRAGHGVLGLARNADAARQLAEKGVDAHRGDLTDADSMASGAAACDGVIHLAFLHDMARYAENAAVDARAVQAMTDALQGTAKPLVATSGTLVLAAGRTGRETDRAASDSVAAVRGAAESLVREAAGKDVRASVIRLAPCVHGPEDHGFIPALVDLAKRRGFSAFVGDGGNRWPAVHRADAARLYRLALEKAPAGMMLHAAADEALPFRDIAAAIGAALDLPVRGLDGEEAQAHFEAMAFVVGIDNPVSSAATRDLMGWSPGEHGLLADIASGTYTA